MNDLVTKLLESTEPSRELDLEIHLAILPEGNIAKITQHRRGLDAKEGYAWDISHGSVVFEKWTDDGRCPYNGGYPLPAFTSSLDEAMKLVPEMEVARCGVWWRIEQSGGSNGSGKNFYIARVYVIIGEIAKDFVGMGDAALALAKASMQARLAISRGPDEWAKVGS